MNEIKLGGFLLSAKGEMEQKKTAVSGTGITVSKGDKVILEGVCEFRVLTETSYMYRLDVDANWILVTSRYQLSGPELDISLFTPGLVTGENIEVRSNTKELVQGSVRGFLAGMAGQDYVFRGADGWCLVKGNGERMERLRNVNIIIAGTKHGVHFDGRGKIRAELMDSKCPTITI